jgi:hypothetical protein
MGSPKTQQSERDRVTPLPAAVKDRLARHLAHVREQHERDVAQGFGRVVLPGALERKYPGAATSLSRCSLGRADAVSPAQVGDSASGRPGSSVREHHEEGERARASSLVRDAPSGSTGTISGPSRSFSGTRT